MSQEVLGLEYLKKKEIKNMKCNMDKPFAFISYSHHDYDSQIVMNVFKKLMDKGYNLWIDVANMPTDENAWKESARTALRNKNCKLAIFFRSESSMVKGTIADEIKLIKILKHIKRIITVDIWHDKYMDAAKCYEEVMNGECEEATPCDIICEYVSTECKAIRLASDAGNDILSLVDEIGEELKDIEDSIITSNNSNVDEKELDKVSQKNMEFDELHTTIVDKSKTTRETDGNITTETVSDSFKYTLWNIPHSSKGLVGLMHDVFDLIAKKYPNKIPEIAASTYISSVARKEDLDGGKLPPNKLSYFRASREHNVENVIYYVGTSYGRNDGIKQLKKMLNLCGENENELNITAYPSKVSRSGGKMSKEGISELL